MFIQTLLVVFSGLAHCVLGQGQIVVDTTYGPVRGHRVYDVYNGEYTVDVYSFLGVPFGKSTDGQRRFAKPEAPDPWTDMFIADTLGTSCPQSGGGLFMMTHPDWDNFGEDCLNVNIHTPVTPGPHPVYVWFHGGAYTGGANIQYPGHFMATRDVVVVVVNYRLNDFGFAFTDSDACRGNFGMWDQHLSLEFVRDNIAAFGGNPDRVTISGQSAGASSSGLHMVSPHSQGLAHQAILESGTESNFWSINWPASQPEKYIWDIAQQLNCSEGNSDQEMIDCLRLLPWELINEVNFDCTIGHFCQGMGPVVDGPGGFIPEEPQVLRASGNIMTGPIINAITKDDGSFYTLGRIPLSLLGGFNRTMFHYYLRNNMLSIWFPNFNETDQENIFRAIDYNYAPWPYVEGRHANREAVNQFITDAAFGHPWDKLNKDHIQYADTYAVVFDYRGRNGTQLFPEWMGVPHMGELPLTWGYPLLKYNVNVRQDSGVWEDIITWTDEDRVFTVFWQKLYANFLHTSNPTPEAVTDPLGQQITWRPFSEDDMAFLYVTNTTIKVDTEWEQKDYAFWREYFPYLTRNNPLPINLKNIGEDYEPLPSTWMEEFISFYFDTINESGADFEEWDYE